MYKDLIVHLYTFLKSVMTPGIEITSPSLLKFYEAAYRLSLVILKDFPEFFSDFHFNFVNSLPEHLIQLRNMVLSAFPPSINMPSPFGKTLKIDKLEEIKEAPKILSNFENYLMLQNLKEDL